MHMFFLNADHLEAALPLDTCEKRPCGDDEKWSQAAEGLSSCGDQACNCLHLFAEVSS